MNNKTNNKDDTIHLIISGKEYNIPPNSKVFQIVKNLLIQSKINSNENIYILPDIKFPGDKYFESLFKVDKNGNVKKAA